MFEGIRFLARAAPHLPRFASYKPGGKDCVPQLLEERAEEFADRPFLHFEQRRISYREHNAAANRVVHWAHERGLRRGDVVALLMENRPEYLAIWMGLSKLGVVTALINTQLKGRMLRHALGTSRAHHLILGAECADHFATTAEDLERCLEVWVEIDPSLADASEPASWGFDLRQSLAGRPETNPPASWRDGLVSGDDLLYIYTSGTTGPPKAARFSHLRFISGGDLGCFAQDLAPMDVHYCALPLYHTAGGVMQVSTVLFGGASLALRRRFSASAFWDDVRKYGATHFQYIGEFCRYLVSQPPRPNDRDHPVRVAIGNGLRPDVWATFRDRFGIPRILEFYGATEANVAFMNFENKEGSVGRFPSRLLERWMSNARLVRFDAENEEHVRGPDGFLVPCGPDEPGELLGRIPSSPERAAGRFEGYTSDEASEQKVLRDVFEKGDAWFRTGDLLRRDAEGFYYFVDRIGDTFRWKGENVSTQEVAEVLSGLPGLDLVNVYGVEVPGADGRAGMMAFVPAPGFCFDGRALYAFVAERLASYAAPVFVRVLEEAELTGTFKLRKVTLRRDGFDPATVRDPLFVRDSAAGAYVPLTDARFQAIRSGELRL
jgi:fatty-acyl-CoA synthase